MTEHFPDAPDIRTASGFMADRQDYFAVSVVRSALGDGWDVVLRVDGSYDTREAATVAAKAIGKMLVEIRDLDHERWYSWNAG
ncbi:MAG TPA: hypothetical protein VEY67_03930 [Candidatus Dormibacteraeota bacterium]|nr:hypothetical protein [Candidatus Dormibacteraeota bacterium]